MQTVTVKPQHVTFDPAAGAFTALVTLHDGAQSYRYPCSFAAPMTMPLSIAAHRLTQQAKQRHAADGQLHSRTAQADSGTLPDRPNQLAAAVLRAA